MAKRSNMNRDDRDRLMFSPTLPECTLHTILKACLYLTLDFCEQPYGKTNQRLLSFTPNITTRKTCCNLPPTISHRAVHMLDQYATDKRSNKPTSSGLVTFSWKSQPDPFGVSGRGIEPWREPYPCLRGTCSRGTAGLPILD